MKPGTAFLDHNLLDILVFKSMKPGTAFLDHNLLDILVFKIDQTRNGVPGSQFTRYTTFQIYQTSTLFRLSFIYVIIIHLHMLHMIIYTTLAFGTNYLSSSVMVLKVSKHHGLLN